jgi:formylglycine-generating enzyme required for sulfatase activity
MLRNIIRMLTGFMLLALLALSGCGKHEEPRAEPAPAPSSEAPPAEPTLGQERIALLIGNSDYSDEGKQLLNPANDANDFAMALENAGFTTQLHLNLSSREALYQTIKAFGEQIANLNGIALVYFAGHGVAYDGKNYLLPTGPHYQYLDDAVKHGLDANHLLKLLGESEGRVNVVILDACRNMPLPKQPETDSEVSADNQQSSESPVNRSSRDIGPPGLSQMQASAGSLLAFSTSYGATAEDGQNSRNSPYANALIRTLAQGGRLDLHSYFNQVRQQVQQQTNGRQLPREESALLGATPTLLSQPFVATPPSPSGQSFRDCTDGSCPEMVIIPSGSFLMGSPANEQAHEDAESPQHRVTISYRLAVGKYEVTFDEWDACVAAGGCRYRPDDQGWGRGRRPVINISWADAQEYIRWLNRKTGQTYRLLSEAEWEYAARAGTGTVYPWGDTIEHNQANCDGCGSQWDSKQTAPAGSFSPNAFGLFDMHGNASEWVQDCFNFYSSAATGGSAVRNNDCSSTVLRGGSWRNTQESLRSAYRHIDSPQTRLEEYSLRLARRLP